MTIWPVLVKSSEEDEFKYFSVFNVVVVILALYLLGYDFITIPGKPLSPGFSVILLALLASPLAIPIHCFVKSWNLKRLESKPADMEEHIEEPLLLSEEKLEEEEEAAEEKLEEEPEAAAAEAVVTVVPPEIKMKPAIRVKNTIFEALSTIDFLDYVCFISVWHRLGACLAVMNKYGTDRFGSWIR